MQYKADDWTKKKNIALKTTILKINKKPKPG
jgi:hypothetical protein